MTVDLNKIASGAATVSLGAYVKEGGAGTLSDIGFTTGPISLTINGEDAQFTFEQSYGPVFSIPKDGEVALKIPMAELDEARLQWILRQATAHLSGTAPNQTLIFDTPEEQYLQVQVAAPGIKGTGGTQGTRTLTLWRCAVVNPGEWMFGKGELQKMELELRVLHDLSISENGDGQFLKIANAGAA